MQPVGKRWPWKWSWMAYNFSKIPGADLNVPSIIKKFDFHKNLNCSSEAKIAIFSEACGSYSVKATYAPISVRENLGRNSSKVNQRSGLFSKCSLFTSRILLLMVETSGKHILYLFRWKLPVGHFEQWKKLALATNGRCLSCLRCTLSLQWLLWCMVVFRWSRSFFWAIFRESHHCTAFTSVITSPNDPQFGFPMPCVQ